MMKLWRDNRSTIIKQVENQAKLVGFQRAASLLKPTNIDSMDRWLAFLKYRTSPQFKVFCELIYKCILAIYWVLQPLSCLWYISFFYWIKFFLLNREKNIIYCAKNVLLVQKMCEKYSKMRASRELLHKTSRKSFAQLEHEMVIQIMSWLIIYMWVLLHNILTLIHCDFVCMSRYKQLNLVCT